MAQKIGEFMAHIRVNGRPLIGCGWTATEAKRNLREQIPLGSTVLLFVDVPVEFDRYQRVSK